ncbi:MAG: AAA family ATPase [bacterium]|nr:AAA family ATPase [bacterium]
MSITETLGIRGWQHLDPVLLASLATQMPLLLVGSHGAGKTELVKKLGNALALKMRHYNASLINYDDLVGIPMPGEGMKGLQFVAAPGSIWDAEFVFFDEVSRCRPDLQNKMFPIVHERTVAGIELERLRHRWGAMNPPMADDADISDGDLYLGAEPLDPALIDRFPFIVTVPTWRDLSRDDRKRLVTGEGAAFGMNAVSQTWLLDLVSRCEMMIEEIRGELHDWLSDYTVSVVELLHQARLPVSARRARTMFDALLAIQAARMVLESVDADLETSAEYTLMFCMPHTATPHPASPAKLVAIHKQAWQIASMPEGDPGRRVLEELDPARRIVLADHLNLPDSDISQLVTQALGAEVNDARRMGLAAVIFLAFHQRRDLSPSAWEPLMQLATRVLMPRTASVQLRAGAVTDIWNEINTWLPSPEDTNSVIARVERNFVLAGFPELWQRYDWKEALQKLRDDINLFKL